MKWIWYRFGLPRMQAELDYWIRGLKQGNPIRKWYGRNWGKK